MLKLFLVIVGLLAVAAVSSSNALNKPCPPPGSLDMKSQFMLAQNYTNFNHGSFGSPPRHVLLRQRDYQDQCEARPDRWIRGGYEAYLQKARAMLAKYLNAEGKDLVFVENASSGVNAAMRSLNLQQGDVILYLSTAYGMVKNTADYLRHEFGVSVIEVPVRFPGQGKGPTDIKGRPITEAVQEAIRQNGEIRLAVFSHVASVPAWVLPVVDLARACNASHIPVFIDGAHALGQVHVDISEMEKAGVTYWVGNGHKWLYSPKGSAVFWVSRWAQGNVVPTVISSAYTTGVVDEHSSFLNHFQYTGTRDYTPFVAMIDALEWREWVGEEQIFKYNHGLAVEAQELLSKMWGTEYLLPAELTAFMGHARIPVNSTEQMSKLAVDLFEIYGYEATLFPLVDPLTSQTSYWARLSAQLYLNIADYEHLGHAVLFLTKTYANM